MAWQLLNLVTAGATLLLALYVIRSLRDFRTTFVVVAVWARYVLSAFDEYTYPPLVAGFSINSLSSIAVAFAGIALIPPYFYSQFLTRLLPLLLILAVIMFSGLINTEFVGMVKDVMKWLYFIALTLLLYRAFLLFDRDRVLRGLLAASLTPLILQAFSVVLGKGGVDDNDTMSYIGGYGGQAGFSLILFTILCLSALIRWRYDIMVLAMVLICLLGIYLANYRTTILAALPLVAVILASFVVKWTPRVLRPLTLLYVLAGGVGAVVLGVLFLPPRFFDIVVVLQSLGELIKPPEAYTAAEMDLFTGRVYLWAHYLSAWFGGSPAVHAFGFGPEAWEGVEPKYAHNTFISYLYEFGLLGLGCLMLFFATQLTIAARATPPALALRLTAAFAGFIIANLATMPLWLIEGLILLATLCALSWATVDAERAAAPARRPIGARWQATSIPHRTGVARGARR
jgi:hypothetical protein